MQTADKVLKGSRVTKGRAAWRSGDRAHPGFKGHMPHSLPSLQDPPSYPPNAIIRRVSRCTTSKLTCAKPGALNPTDLRLTGKSLERSHQSDLAVMDPESVSSNFLFPTWFWFTSCYSV
jgi:hypothetical protein